jgi:hypothetical protein
VGKWDISEARFVQDGQWSMGLDGNEEVEGKARHESTRRNNPGEGKSKRGTWVETRRKQSDGRADHCLISFERA